MTRTKAGRRENAWFALVDAEACRLLYCSLTRRGQRHVDQYDALESSLPQQEFARPKSNADVTHSVEDKERRFGSEIVAWLQKKTVEFEVDHLVIFAPPRMLGVLRMVPLGSLNGHVEELKGDLMRLSTGQLADHPMIHDMVMQQSSNDRGGINTPAARNLIL